jgi:hypothetical protein
MKIDGSQMAKVRHVARFGHIGRQIERPVEGRGYAGMRCSVEEALLRLPSDVA